MKKKEITGCGVQLSKESVSSQLIAKGEGETAFICGNVQWKDFKGDTDEEKQAAAKEYSAQVMAWMLFLM